MKCPFCENGKIKTEVCGKTSHSAPVYYREVERTCPHCEDGVITLAVEEDCPFYLGICVDGCPEHHEVRCNHNACITRPLTDEEVEQLMNFQHPQLTPNKFAIKVAEGKVYWHGLPVVIKKGE